MRERGVLWIGWLVRFGSPQAESKVVDRKASNYHGNADNLEGLVRRSKS